MACNHVGVIGVGTERSITAPVSSVIVLGGKSETTANYRRNFNIYISYLFIKQRYEQLSKQITVLYTPQ
jgi:hypothetical protein